MPQAVWVGQLSFGLVNIPVRLYGATSPKSVRFHQYEAGTGRRVHYRRVASEPSAQGYEVPLETTEDVETRRPVGKDDIAPTSAAGEEAGEAEPYRGSATDREPEPEPDAEVPWDRIVKGFEVEPGRVVTVTRDELLAQAPERSHVLEVEQFVDLREIDPIHFDKSYYVVPQAGPPTERPYWLLYRAMESAGKVAIGRFVMRTKEHLVAVRPGRQVLLLETLFYADEVRDPKEVWRPLIEEPSERELQMARQLIGSLTFDWEPARYRDEHRERILELLRSKSGEAFEPQQRHEELETGELVDLMAALEASVEAARRARHERSEGTGSV